MGEQIYGSLITTKVLLRNDYLYLSWGGGLKLTEYQPGPPQFKEAGLLSNPQSTIRNSLFFTAEGESVKFVGDRMSLGNRPFFKRRAAGGGCSTPPKESDQQIANTPKGSGWRLQILCLERIWYTTQEPKKLLQNYSPRCSYLEGQIALLRLLLCRESLP